MPYDWLNFLNLEFWLADRLWRHSLDQHRTVHLVCQGPAAVSGHVQVQVQVLTHWCQCHWYRTVPWSLCLVPLSLPAVTTVDPAQLSLGLDNTSLLSLLTFYNDGNFSHCSRVNHVNLCVNYFMYFSEKQTSVQNSENRRKHCLYQMNIFSFCMVKTVWTVWG